MDFAFGPYFEKQYLVSFQSSSYLLCEFFSLKKMRSFSFKSFTTEAFQLKLSIPKRIILRILRTLSNQVNQNELLLYKDVPYVLGSSLL